VDLETKQNNRVVVVVTLLLDSFDVFDFDDDPKTQYITTTPKLATTFFTPFSRNLEFFKPRTNN
jgi:hypothetical protein